MKLVKEEIFSYSKGENLFVAGERLSEQDSIGYINHIEAENRFTTVVVENGEEYFVDVNLKKLERSTCDCKNYEKNNRCIHILALMFRVVELTKEVEIEESATETLITTNFLNYFGLNTNSYPVLRLYPKIFINEKTNIYNVEFAIGEAGERPYIVKNLGEVLHALLNRKSIELGKKFVFETNEYKLDAFSTKVLNLISGHEAINMYRRTLRRFTALEFDKMQMTKFLDDLRETSFELNFKEIEITSAPLPIDLHVKYEEHEIIFELNEQVEVEHIIKNCFLKIEDKYYFLDDNQIEIYRLFDPLLQGEVNITINSKYFENVVVDIMEKVKKVFNISAADVFFQKPIEAELVIEVYMETTLDNEFKITPVFKYEDVEYGFDGVKVNDDHTKLVTRDTFMEKRVKQILQRLGLQETATGDEFGYFLTKNVNQRFEILTEVIPELAEFSQLFIDEKIKRRLRKSSDNQIAFSMKKGNDLNFFEIDFNIEGLTQKEISEILESYHQKNQFHELKNGELFVFDDEEVMKQLDFIDQMPSLFSYDDHRVPIYHLLAVDQLARSLFTNIDVDQEIEKFVEKALNPQDISNKISINANMREYQEYGVSWLNNLYQAGLGGILCDEMGLGKTIQILGFLTTLDADFKALIVVPKALIYNWIAEIQKFAPGLTYQQIEGSKEERTIAIEQVNNYNISITSYNMARIDEQAYEDIEFDFVILDEAQYIKNFSTKVSKSIKKLKSRQKFALTGTPIENNLLELWSIIDFAMPNYLGTRQKF
ncbi:MAG: SNF2-related protein, partial [Mycoplasmatales bacterium]